jgi:hypothetical protein
MLKALLWAQKSVNLFCLSHSHLQKKVGKAHIKCTSPILMFNFGGVTLGLILLPLEGF